MQAETKLFAILIPFFVVMTIVYAYFTGLGEWVGIVGLLLTACLCGFVAFYLWLTARKIDERPEDRLDGEIAEASGDYGFFSPHSWWPLWLGLASATLFLGVAVGWWLFVIAAPFAVLATIGWTFEYFRGEHAV
ncbi:MAG: cytochrome c oxidase subunit 4 [Ornithinimicrobium sp.]